MKERMLTFYLSVLGFIFVYTLLAFILVYSQQPKARAAQTTKTSLDFSSALEGDYQILPDFGYYQNRRSKSLPYRKYSSVAQTQNILLLLHGSAWHSMQFHALARHISQAGVATVLTPDLRGHGFQPERRGDIDYLGQFEDDLADLILSIK